MAIDRMDFTSESVAKAMLDGLTERVRSELRARIMERIAPDIEAAVDAGLASFKLSVETMYDHANIGAVVRVLTERKDKAQCPPSQ